MRTVKVSDGRGVLYFIRPQATKFSAEDMRTNPGLSPSGRVHMDKLMGRSFTFKFLCGSALAALTVAYAVDWIATNFIVWPLV